MSHLPQRKEKNCLNCGTEVVGKYCHNCGQENTEPKESVWQLISHFFNDITHFDGKFFSTLKDLILKPGFLSKEYMNGRRARYLNPVRMYIFTSFIFFLIFFSVYHISDNGIKGPQVTIDHKTDQQIDSMSAADFNDFTKSINHGIPMSREEFKHYKDSSVSTGILYIFGNNNKAHYQNKEQYDSVLARGKVNDGWLKRHITYKEIEINTKYHDQQGKFISDFTDSLMHHFPQILFVSLPFVALILKLLYIRRKQFYYVSHAIFSIHFYIFVFIVMLFTMGFSGLEKLLHWNWISYINGLLTIAIFFYLYKAMRNFYKQRRAKTILKYFLFSFSFFFLIVFLFLIFSLVSIFQV